VGIPEELKQRLAETDEVVFALLFGSRAAGAPRTDSDWDVGVYLSPQLTPKERFESRLKLVAALQDVGNIEVVILNDAPPLLAQRALQGKRLLVKDPKTFVRFFVRTQAEAGDEQYWRRIHAAARARRLQEGQFGRP
jgi:predicted nucleotidyltransferase